MKVIDMKDQVQDQAIKLSLEARQIQTFTNAVDQLYYLEEVCLWGESLRYGQVFFVPIRNFETNEEGYIKIEVDKSLVISSEVRFEGVVRTEVTKTIRRELHHAVGELVAGIREQIQEKLKVVGSDVWKELEEWEELLYSERG